MESRNFYLLVADFFGAKATMKSFDRSVSVFTCDLYESFRFRCGLDGEHGTFNGGIEYAPERYFSTFFGVGMSLNPDPESIVESLRRVDEWCRLRLPDKFLERYDAALATHAS